MLQLGKDREGRPVHKGEVVKFIHNGTIKQGVLQGMHQDKDIKMLIVLRNKQKYYVFERELVAEVRGRLLPASVVWTKALLLRIGL